MVIQITIKSTPLSHKFGNLDTINLLYFTKLDAKVYHFISYLEILSFILMRALGQYNLITSIIEIKNWKFDQD